MADEPGDEPTTKTPAADLGDAGKKALDEERKGRREAEKRAKDLEQRLAAIEDEGKSELERLTEKTTQLERDLATATAKADRFEVALEKGLDPVRAKRLTGATREELEADADELSAWNTGQPPASPSPGKPTEALTGGGDPTEEPAVDVREVVDSIPRGF